jgi:hypothetical protein
MKRLFLLSAHAFKYTAIAYWLLYLAAMILIALTHPLNELYCNIADSKVSGFGFGDPLVLSVQCTSKTQYVLMAIIYGLPFTIGIWLSLSLLVLFILVIFASFTCKLGGQVEH